MPTKKQNLLENTGSRVDYKDTELLKKFINPHSRMLSRKKTGISAKDQRNISAAIKQARFMALIPYVSR